MAIAAKMLSLLRDPRGLEPLEIEGDSLVNKASQRRYAIVDSIPVLVETAEVGPQNLKMQRMYRWMSKGFDLANHVGDWLILGRLSKLRRLLATRLGLKPGDRLLNI